MTPPDPQRQTIPGLPPEEEQAVRADSDGAKGSTAAAEARQIASGLPADELARQARELEHGRTQRFRNHFEILIIGGMYSFAITLAVIGATWLWHLITPEQLHWLKSDALAHVQNIFTGGILAGVIAEHFKKRLG